VLRPPVQPMLAATVQQLPGADAYHGGTRYEPKFDGWRALAFTDRDGVYLQSRSGKPLGDYFPDVTRLLHDHLPPGVVLDGELVGWDPESGRTSFSLLQRRVTAGRHISVEAAAHPTHLVVFDLLQDPDGRALLDRPLERRRTRLQRLLADAPPQVPLCPHTADMEQACGWLDSWTAAGVEGLVIKGANSRYQPGRRGWAKLKARRTTEAIVAGVTGNLHRPQTLLLGRLDATGRLRFIGRTVPLPPDAAHDLAHLLNPIPPSGATTSQHPWPNPLPAGWHGHFQHSQPEPYLPVEPVVVVEIDVDVAYEQGRFRHPVRYRRARADLAIDDAPLHTPSGG
jgi:ATP-dependent DNA ligase